MSENDSNYITILVNRNADRIGNLFFNENCIVKKLFDSVYYIIVDGKKLDWLVKIYDKQKYAKIENSNLMKLKDLKGVPDIAISSFSKGFNYLIISRVKGEDLCEYMHKYGLFSEQEVKNIIKQLLVIVKHMHAKKIIHKDIKPENIIYDKKTGTVVLIDFEGKQTKSFLSPEQCKYKSKLTEKTDIWSIGITLYNLVTGEVPFQGKTDVLNKVADFDEKWSEDMKDFTECLLEKDIQNRYSAKDALNHNWLNS